MGKKKETYARKTIRLPKKAAAALEAYAKANFKSVSDVLIDGVRHILKKTGR